RTANQQLADAALWIRLKQFKVDDRRGKTHRFGPRARVLVRQVGRYGRAFREAKAIADARVRERLDDARDQIRSNGRTAVRQPADARGVEVFEVRLIDSEPVDR